MRRALVLVIVALAAGLASPAWADKDKDNKGRGKHGHGDRGDRGGPVVIVQPVRVIVPDRDRAVVYQYYRSEFSAGRCPPGLAKKGNGCLPPGQAKKQLYVIGQPLPPAVVYQPVPPVVVQQLAPVPPGYEYVRVDDDVLLMDKANRMVADIVNDLNDYDSLGLD